VCLLGLNLVAVLSFARPRTEAAKAKKKGEWKRMKYLPVRCELHGWLLLDPEYVSGDDPVIECEGHMIGKNVRGIALIETTEYLPKTRGLTDAELGAITARVKGKKPAE
jgi:hypothetical protein